MTLVERLWSAKILSVDTETNGEDIRDGRGYLMGISIAGKVDGEIISGYFPFRHNMGENLPSECLDAVRKLLESDKPKIMHNFKFDIVSLQTIGINIGGTLYCTIKCTQLINENLFSYSLNAVAARYLSNESADQKDISEEFKKVIDNLGWVNIPVGIMRSYAVRDAELPLRILEQIWPKFKEEISTGYWQHKNDLVFVIIAMEKAGIRIDVDLCKKQIEIGESRMEEIYKELGGYSPTSPIDLKVLLIERLGLPVFKRTKKGAISFDKYAMELYDEVLSRMDSPVAKLIVEYRGWQKTVSSNYQAYLELLSPDGRLRPNYILHGTVTGRSSCREPNLQQIPRTSDKPWNGALKQAFIPQDDYSIWEADYSQLELRLGTAYAKEESLLQVFEEGRDIFTEMSLMIGLSRYDTKHFVYSTQYGAGLRRLKVVLGLSDSETKQIRDNYFQAYPRLRMVSERAAGMARAARKVKLWTGRYRHFQNPDEEAHKAFNSIIQGGAADIVEYVMVRLYKEIVLPSNDECRMLLQVHDSVVFEIKQGREGYYRERIIQIMEDIDAITAPESFGVKFHVSFKPWGE